MGSIGTNKGPAVKRQDISNLTKSQQFVMQQAYNDIEFARTHSFDDYAIYLETRHEATNMSEIDNYRPVGKWQDYGYASRDEAVKSFRESVERIKDNPNYQKFYNDERNGLARVQASSSTVRALEKKGYLEYIKDGGRGIDHIKIIEK